MPTHTLTIPGWHPTRANQMLYRHWHQIRRRKKADADLVAAYALQQGIPRAAGPRRVGLTLHGWGKGGPFPDRDAFDKSLLDALVKCGLLVDDSPRWLVGRVEVECVRSKQKQTVIRLEDVSDV